MPTYSVLGPERIDRQYYEHWVVAEYPYHDWYIVEAPNRKVAAWAAFRRAKKNKDRWYTELEDSHPLKGVKIEPWPPDLTNDIEDYNLTLGDIEDIIDSLSAGPDYYVNAFED